MTTSSKINEIDLQSGLIVNKNLLHNWYFGNPVNRNGLSEYKDKGQHVIDRWRITNVNTMFTVDSGKCVLSNNGNANGYLQQFVSIPRDLYGKNITITFLTGDGLFTKSGVIPASIPTSRTPIASTTIPTGSTTNGVWMEADGTLMIQITASSGNSTELYAVKLELGDTQTLAHQENGVWVLNEVPDYAEQMAICSQYDKMSGAYLGATRHTNPNLLHNWYFKNPVNQRGKTEYTEAGYTIDRWYLNAGGGSNITVEDDGIHYQHGDGVASSFVQGLATADSPYVLEELKGKTVTLTTLYGDNLLATSTFTVPTSISANVDFGRCERPNNARAYHCMRWYTNGIFRVEMYETGNNTEDFTVVAMKLELGSEQTLAHQENGVWVLNEIPDFGEQLAICQRYQIEIFDKKAGGQGYLTSVRGTHTGYAYGVLPLPVTMREGAKPSLITDCSAENPYNAFGVYSDGYNAGSGNIKSIKIYSVMNQGVIIMAEHNGRAFVSGNSYTIWVDSQSIRQFLLDRNL